MTGTRRSNRDPVRPDAAEPGGCIAYTVCVLTLLYAAVSFYWAAGGTAGLSTIGGELEEMARARDPGIVAIVLVVGLLKVAYGLLTLAPVRPWGRAFPRWVLLATAWPVPCCWPHTAACWWRCRRWLPPA